MGCCGGVMRDKEIERTTNMDELINVMKKKKENLAEEKKQIEDHLKDPSKEITIVNLDATKEGMEKRLPYIDRINECYGEIIEKLETVKNLPFSETKEHMFNIVYHYFITYDETYQYMNDLAKFKQFAFKYEQQKQ